MNYKDLLIVYNCYGLQEDVMSYKKDIDSILWHINKNNLQNRIRFVISAVLKPERVIDKLKNIIDENIKIFKYENNFSVQVTFNKTTLVAEEYFNEEYEGYLYTSPFFIFPQIDDLFPRIFKNLFSGQYGIMHLYADVDNGGIDYPSDVDRILYMGTWAHLNGAIIHRSIKDFYGVPLSDVHGKSSTEWTYPYVCSALRKKYIILGNSTCHHIPQSDGPQPDYNSRGEKVESYQSNDTEFLWGLSIEKIKNDKEALESGLGYFCDHDPRWEKDCQIFENRIQHDTKKYDERSFSIDYRLKYAVKRNFFVSKEIFNYKNLKYEVV